MSITALQKAVAQAIVNIFETGSVRGNYADVTLLPGDSGELTYGRSQTTLASGNLYLLIKAYSDRTDGAYSTQFRPYLPQLEHCDSALDHDSVFRSLLADAGADPVMQDVQDAFFDQVYWSPAIRSANALGVVTALGTAIVYDSTVHGSWAHVRDLTRGQFGELSQIGEKAWMAHYVQVRRNWLATFPNPLLHKTVYRMDALQKIIDAGNWDLTPPITVRGLVISEETLANATPVRAPAEAGPKRLLVLTSPMMAGPDVDWLQQRLLRVGIHVDPTGSYDAQTEAGVRAFQEAHDLKTDGIVGPVTRTALEDLSVTAPAPTPEANAPMPSVARAPATTLSAPAAAPAQAPVLPASAVADIKQHITAEVRANAETLRQTIQDEHARLAVEIAKPATSAAPHPAVEAPAKLRPAAPSSQTLDSVLANWRPLLAALTSVLALAFSQVRDAIVWISGLPGAPSTPPTAPGAPPPPPSSSPLQQIFDEVHTMAATLPSEWVYRIRVAGLALLIYVLYRLIARHFDIRRLQREIQAGAQLESEVASVVKTH